MRKFLRYGLVAMLFLVALDASGGKLGNFAEKATGKTPKSEKKKSPPSEDIASSAFGSGTYPSSDGGDSFLGGFWSWLVAAPFQYRQDDPAASMSQDEGDEGRANGRRFLFPRHELGQATVPYARFDYHWQYVDSDIDASDVRIELGYKVLAFHARTTMYDDPFEDEKLDINQYYGVLRYGGYRPDFVPGTFEFGTGFGAAQMKYEYPAGTEEGTGDPYPAGTIRDTAFAWTILLKYYPVEWLGLEFRPAWYSFDERVGDYDLSASLGWRYVQFRGGYRWLKTRGERLDGPYAGVSVSF